MDLADEKYVLLTTFRRDGSPVATPVWIADLGDGRAGFTTSSVSGKVKRIRASAEVTLQPCNASGTVADETTPTRATARVAEGDEYASVRAAIDNKYGWQTRAIRLGVMVRGWFKRGKVPASDAAVIVSFGGGPSEPGPTEEGAA